MKIRYSVLWTKVHEFGVHVGQKLKLHATETFLTYESGSLGEAALPCSQEKGGCAGLPESIPALCSGVPTLFQQAQSTLGVTSQLGVFRLQVWEYGHFLSVGFPSEL